MTPVYCCDPRGIGEPGTPVLCGRCYPELSHCVSRLLQVTAGNALSNRRETRLNSWFTYISITLKLGWFQSCQGTV